MGFNSVFKGLND